MKSAFNKRHGGFTVVELLVAVPVALACVALVFTFVWTATNLMARNMAINMAHMNTLNPLQRIMSDVHRAITIPQLTGTLTGGTFPIQSGTGPAPGVQFQLFFAGPYALHNNTNVNDTNIQIEVNGNDPGIKAGMHLVIPSYYVDEKITSVTSNGPNRNCKIDSQIGVAITTQGGTGGGSNGTAVVPVYVVIPTNYCVSKGALTRYDDTGAQAVILRNVTSANPFTKPTSDNRFIGIHLSASNPDYNNRRFGAADMLYDNVWVPFRGQLTP